MTQASVDPFTQQVDVAHRAGVLLDRVPRHRFEARALQLQGEALAAQSFGDRYKSGRSGCWGLLVPSVDVVVELAVEDAGADLEEVMGTGRGPLHLLFLHHRFRDDAVHGDLRCS